MCGIGGCVVPPGERPDRTALARMADALAHRGPDESGVEVHGTVGLVNTRLAIVEPTEAARQPMAHPSRRWLVTYNGEIFNHAELRRELPAASYRGHGDTETLVHALDAWGAAAVPRLNGPFAFAALHEPGRRLLLARDRFGKKPLSLAREGGAVWFASEMRALFAAGVPQRTRPDVLAHSLAFRWPQGRVTPVEGVERLLPATLTSVDLETLAVASSTWYRPGESVDPRQATRLARADRVSLTSRIEATLRAAVGRRLLADVPVGVMLSGGLDSSLVAALAHREGTTALTAYAGSVEGGGRQDELPWARRVTDALGMPLEPVSIDADGWRGALVPAVDHFEYPLQHESAVSIAQISEVARRHGVKVLLTGEGADELFGGYPFLHREAFGDVFGRRAGARPEPPAPAFADLAPAPEVDAFERAVDRDAAEAYAHHDGPRAALEAGLLGDLSRNVLPFLLNRLDKNAMQWSVETRLPFLDPEVVGLAVNLPLEHRVGRGRKELLRAVAARHLPAAVAARGKQVGLRSRAARWLRQEARATFLEDGVLPGADRRAGRSAGAPACGTWPAPRSCRCGRARSGAGSPWRGARGAPSSPSSGADGGRQ